MTRTVIIRRTLFVCSLSVFTQGVAAGQAMSPRFYVAGVTAVDGGSRGNIPSGAVPSAGGLFGIRITEAWSLEAEIERGFRKTELTSGEALFVSYAPRDATREEIERHGIWARWQRTEMADVGWAAQAMWRTHERRRLNAGLVFGVAARTYLSRVIRTPTRFGPDLDRPPSDPALNPSDETRRMVGGGLTGGFVILGQLTPSLTISPEFRYTHGLITDEPYRVFKSGVRLIWSF